MNDSGSNRFKRVSSGSPFEQRAAYCRAIVDDLYVHISGTIGVDPRTRILPGDAREQTLNIFLIAEAALAAEHAGLHDVVRTRVYVTDAAFLDAVVSVLAEKFRDCPPTNTTLICGIPAPGAKVEIEFTARRPVPPGI